MHTDSMLHSRNSTNGCNAEQYSAADAKQAKIAWLSRYQLAFALLITELLPGLREPLDTYDPAFNDVDRALLTSLGVTVSAHAAKRMQSMPCICHAHVSLPPLH